jgi:2-polyprenyl-3-methyl-5-hydroxy-6-metoxy-1,4-benzoquinol methylase
MTTSKENIQRNIEVYDNLYARTNVEAICAKVRNQKEFLREAIATDTSWHGFWHGDFAEQIRGKTILEVGCGDGLNALIMATLGAKLVVANDISTESGRIITDASSRLNLGNIEPRCGNLSDLSLPLSSFDMVVGKDFLHHLTHELELSFLKSSTRLLNRQGSARFFEPAVNSRWLDKLRWITPVRGRPSILQHQAFRDWKRKDAHPERDNSSRHFYEIGKAHFESVELVPLASIERFCRLLRRSEFQRMLRRWSHRAETRLPMWVRWRAARSQLIIYRTPKM